MTPSLQRAGTTTIVAVGASAGGLDALRGFFGAMAPHPRLAFVVVTHLSPHHHSNMPELLGRTCALSVTEARAGARVEPGVVYVIPPGHLMSIRNGTLELENLPPRPASLRTIDHFMRSLAEDRPEHCAGIVMSGSDHDGTIGLKDIKAAGGLAIVQDPDGAEYPSMPKSAITAGAADLVLPVESMGQALLEFVEHAPENLATEIAAPASEPAAALVPLHDIVALIQTRTGHDFQWYRPAMLLRRLRRRMGLRSMSDVSAYAELLAASREELDALVRDFLISVTEFFRDPEAWETLANEVLPALVQDRQGNEAGIRVWTPGCATGEESLTIAMMLLDEIGVTPHDQRVSVFGTDVDAEALRAARAGSYPAAACAMVSPDRLNRYFEKAGDHYVARKLLRDSVLFAHQNLVRDPPFSKVDLIVCRNVLIYFEPAQQSRLLELFHFALNPGGILFLGKSESISAREGLFEGISRPHRIFRRLEAEARLPGGFVGRWSGPGGFLTPQPLARPGAARTSAELVREQLGDRPVVAAMLVNRDDRVLYLHGEAARYTRQSGEPAFDLPSLLREGLSIRVHAALRRAVDEGHPVSVEASLQRDGSWVRVEIRIEPLPDSATSGLYLVCFDEPPDVQPVPAVTPPGLMDDAALLRQLEKELGATRAELQAALEEGERATAELRVTNEEAMSLNEELQSSNEELETSREELQSVNEELATVNGELEEKLAELERALNDVRNLMDNARVATLFLDRDLRIRRFTREVSRLFHVIGSDEGRPLRDLASRVTDPDLIEEARAVLLNLAPAEKEVATTDGDWFLRRILPYRTQDERIDGVVVTYVEITRLRLAAQEARRLSALLRDTSDAVITLDPAGRIVSWNRGAERAYGFVEQQVRDLEFTSLVPEAQREAARAMIEHALRTGSAGPEHGQRIARDRRVLDVSVTLSVLRDDEGKAYALVSTERDVTEQLRLQTEVRFRAMADEIPTLLRIDDASGRAEFLNRAWREFTGESAQEALLERGWLRYVHPDDLPFYMAQVRDTQKDHRRSDIDLRLRRADGQYQWMRSTIAARYDEAGALLGFTSVSVDIEERKRAEDALADAARRKDEFLAMLAHELRNPLAPIINAADVIGRVGPAEPKLDWATGVITRQAHQLARLLDDLMDMGRITSGKIVVHREPVDLSVAIAQACEACQVLIDARRQRFTVTVPHEPLLVEGDLARLAQIVGNLLNNASKFTREGGEISLNVTASADVVELTVTDNGIGITPELLPHVFDLFAQGERSLDRALGGLGIGLTLVQRLVQLHGGSVEAHSAGRGAGSRFVVRLPLLHLPQRSTNPEHPAEPAAQDARRVLVVDDNTDGAQALAIILEFAGHAVRVEYDGAAALAAAEEFRPHVIVMDIGLPGTNGYDVARQLRARRETANTLMIAFTGYGQGSDLAASKKAGFDHHVVKPADPDRILALIQRAPRGNGP